MKTFRYYSSLLFAAFTLCACDAFEIDNYSPQWLSMKHSLQSSFQGQIISSTYPSLQRQQEAHTPWLQKLPDPLTTCL